LTRGVAGQGSSMKKKKKKGTGRPKLDLKAFERRIRIRPLEIGDFDNLVRLQEACFPGMVPWKREQIESQLDHFPEGQMAVELDGEIVASSSSLIVDFSEYSAWHSWKEISDSGYIRNHDPEGDTLYGIEIMVDPRYRGLKLARRLYSERKRLAREHNLMRIIVGGRIPGYGSHADEMSAVEYVERVMDKTLFDPVLTAQLANGFVLKQLVPNYFPGDDDSRGYATFLEWTNLDHTPREIRHFRAVAPVRIAVVQYEMRRVSSFEEFGRSCEYFIDVASDYKADFILFPELVTNQLLSLIEAHRPGLAARELARFTEPYLELFGRLAIKYDVNVIGGSHFTIEDDALYNVSYLFRRDGTLGKQYKLHITPNEKRWWGVVPGNRLEVFDTDRGRIAINVCYDVEFPELARIASDKGAHLLFVPFNTDMRAGYLRVRLCAQARCIENHMYTAISGCIGNLPFVENADIHYAQSGIFTPADIPFALDAVAAECQPNIETLLIHDLDLELLKRHRQSGTVQNWKDRRTDLYTLAYRDEDGQRVVGARRHRPVVIAPAD
jgi:predicted amidohydrolase/ribosomal protein S18 acetylase RimI-like enzyme